ncbi:RNA-binding protein squid-like [Leptinotarsa decemlineata]|uniref:RNA-binding protein squid-like n=1 Tax=Leptinotarsa decemlineata TaxID=7539 RepID=UPI003D30790F
MDAEQNMSSVEQVQQNCDFQCDTSGSDIPAPVSADIASVSADIASVSADIPASVSSDIPASSDPSTVDGGNADARKLFVGGMHFQTGEKELREHFGQYGEIENIKITTDPVTGRSRGFAFIVFKSVEALSKVEVAGDHIINGKKVDPKKAKGRQGKIFVGGLTADLTDDDIKSHFAQFGTIADTQMPFDKVKNQRKGFCFIIFESEQVVRDLIKNPKQTIKGKEVDVKRANSNQMSGPMMRGRGARGGMQVGRGGMQVGRGGMQVGRGGMQVGRGGMQRGRGGIREGRGGRGGFGGPGFDHSQQGFGSGYENAGGYGPAFDYYGGAAFGGYGQRYQPY